MVTVRVFGALRQALGRSEVELPCAGVTVKDALIRLAASCDGEVANYIFDKQGNLWRSLMLLVNDEPVSDALHQRTNAGDVISLLLPLAGG
jgi:molybdopterin converting factor small subunit